MWRHKFIHARLRIDGSRRKFQIVQRFRVLTSFFLKDVLEIRRGTFEEYGREMMQKTVVVHLHPQKTLEFLFETKTQRRWQKHVEEKVQLADRHKRDKFLRNVRFLLDEISGDSAYFFSTDGHYGRVSRSVFDRWHRINLKAPGWRPSGVLLEETKEDVPRIEVHHKRKKKKTVLSFPPLPLEDYEKPQNQRQDLLYQHGEVGARLYSTTKVIDYGTLLPPPFNKRHKEVYVLQKCMDGGPRSSSSGVIPLTLGSLPLAERIRKFSADSHLPMNAQPLEIPLVDLLPYFVEKVEKQFGDIGVRGWRNAATGEFQLDDWAQLCHLALKDGDNAAATAVLTLETGSPKLRRARKELLKSLYGQRNDFYDASVKTYNASMKLQFDNEQRQKIHHAPIEAAHEETKMIMDEEEEELPEVVTKGTESKRRPTMTAQGFRFEVVILEHEKKLGLYVLPKTIRFAGTIYNGLQIVNAEDPLPTVEIAYSSGHLRKGDVIVGVNGSFPKKHLTHLLARPHKRKLTVVRLHVLPTTTETTKQPRYV